MKSASSSRRIYPRGGSFVLAIAGEWFGPKSGARSKLDPKVEVTTQVLKPGGGVKRIEVTQHAGTPSEAKETWTTKVVVFKKRTPKDAPAAEMPPTVKEGAIAHAEATG